MKMQFRHILKISLLLFMSAGAGISLPAQELYHQWFGKATSPCIVFLHGGPGFNCANFEISTAEKLAKKGFRVLTYDRRGTGRSAGISGKFTYEEAVSDLQNLLSEAEVQKATLIGHSFGGAVAVKFAEAHPEMVDNLVLVSAPMDFPGTFRAIQENCRSVYEEKNPASVAFIDKLADTDSTTLEYSSQCFFHALACGLYQPSDISEKARKLNREMRSDPQAKWLVNSSMEPVSGFHANEAYTTQNFYPLLSQLAEQMTTISILGEEDGLFNAIQMDKYRQTLGPERAFVIPAASHNVFIDQQKAFLDLICEVLKN